MERRPQHTVRTHPAQVAYHAHWGRGARSHGTHGGTQWGSAVQQQLVMV